MSDRVCPYLGTIEGEESYLAYPSHQNRCYAGGVGSSIDAEKQQGFCLGGKYATCPSFVHAAYPQAETPLKPIRLTPSQTSPSRAQAINRAVSVLLIMLGLVLMGSGGVMALQYQSKIGMPPPTPIPTFTHTPAPQVDIPTPTCTPTVTTAPTSTHTTTPTAMTAPVAAIDTPTPTHTPSPTLIVASSPIPPTPTPAFDPPETGGETPDTAAMLNRTGPSRIIIPRIGVDSEIVPVAWHMENHGGVQVGVWDVADYAVGWHINSAVPGEVGNIVLSGHHNIKGEVFRYLVELEPGDEVTVYMGETPYYYRVQEKFILRDKGLSDEERQENAKWIGEFDDERLTMITCWPYTNNTHRVIVIAKPAPQE